MAYSVPNHTQVPNELLEVHMKEMSQAELKVVLAVCRKTFGWHKGSDRISISQLMELTGMTRNSVSAGIKAAMARGVLARREIPSETNSHAGFEYGLILRGGSTNSVLGGGSNSIPGSRGKGRSKFVPTKERKRNSYINNKEIKDYLDDPFVAWIED